MTGRTIAHYELVEKIGEGGMGAVYKARDKRLARFVAVKILAESWILNSQQRQRFLLEARVTSALSHPNIVTVHDLVEEGGRSAIVMEYVAGRNSGRADPRGRRAHAGSIEVCGLDRRRAGRRSCCRDLSPRSEAQQLWAQKLAPQTRRPLGAPLPVLHLHGSRHAAGGLSFGDAITGDALYCGLREMSSNIWLASPD